MPYFLITVIKNVNSFCSLHYYVSSSKLAKALVKRTRKFPRNYTQFAKSPFHWFISCYKNDCRSLNLRWLRNGGQTVIKFRRLVCIFDESERKQSRVNTSARKPWPNEVAIRPKFPVIKLCAYSLTEYFQLSIGQSVPGRLWFQILPISKPISVNLWISNFSCELEKKAIL